MADRHRNPCLFVSASVPDPRRDGRYYGTANIPAIRAAVTALVNSALGKKRIVWGGHPSITPMIELAAAERQIGYRDWVTLYQSMYFEEDFPKENRSFRNVVYTERRRSAAASLEHLRRRMISENDIDAAVFICGMEGVEAEFRLVQSLRPNAKLLPLASTGGAAHRIYANGDYPEELSSSFAYNSIFQSHLGLRDE